MEKQIRTRFSPSPTGFLHVGGLRTALYNYLFAKKNKGIFLLRIEDTDQNRLIKGAEENLKNILEIFSLKHNEKSVRQSDRLDIYKKRTQELLKKDGAYLCFCTAERLESVRKVQQGNNLPTRYDGHCRMLKKEEAEKKIFEKTPFVVRQKLPKHLLVEFTDLVRGTISINTDTLDDQVLMKSDGWPTYHLASVIDDHEMEITHVIRGEEWLPSTPKHVLLYRVFGWEEPKFAHLPLLLNSDRSKLSKRQGDVSVDDYLKKGFLKEALLNFILLLGWNPGTEKEIFSLNEMEKEFSLEKVNKSGAVFNVEKLEWLNGHYIKTSSAEKLFDLALPFFQKAGFADTKNIEKIKKIILIEQERIKKLSELPELSSYFFSDISYDPKILVWKKQTTQNAVSALKNLCLMLEKMEESEFTQKTLEEKIITFIEGSGHEVGEVLWPMRVSLCGRKASPSPFEIADVLGKKESIKRIHTAISLLAKM